MFSRNSLAHHIAVASTAFLLAPLVNADDFDFAIDEIVVTAQKRSESVQDVPIAISAVGEEMLAYTGVNTVTDIVPMVPGLTGTSFGVATNTWAIRGISSNDWTTGSEPSVGVFFDDAYIGRNTLSTTAFFDVNRVEVVKGPQGTLFGRNAAAGAISIVSNKPGDENELDLGVTVGDEGQREYNTVANLAVSDTFALRVAYHGERLDGIWENVTQGEDGFNDSDNARVMARWNPTDTLEALLTLHYGEYENNLGTLVSTVSSTVQPGEEDYDKIANSRTNREENKTDGAALRLTWDINDDLTLTSITDFRSADYSFISDGDGTADDEEIDLILGFGAPITGGMTIDFGTPYSKLSSKYQEFRLNGSSDNLDWFVGASYFEEDVKERTVVSFRDTALGLGALFRDDYSTKGETESVGLYADATLALTDRWSVTGGVRWSQDKKDWCTNTVESAAFFTPAPTDGEVCDDAKWTETTPRLVVEYGLGEDAMLFASVAKGYKGGGFNGAAIDSDMSGTAETVVAFDPETNTAYELGLKSTLLDGRMQFNASAYLNDYQDLQVQRTSIAGVLITNADEAETMGAELEMTYMPLENLTLNANYAYLDAEFKKGAEKGKTLAYAPDHSFSVSANYDIDFSAGTVSLFAMYNRMDSYFHDIDNAVEEDAYGLLNSRITFTPNSEQWDLSLAVDNLTDETYAVSRSDSGFGPTIGNLITRGMPRLIRAEFNLHL